MDTSSFKIVGHYSICNGDECELETNDILKDKEFNYWYKRGSEIIKYPWESRILDATQVWTNADCYQSTSGKWVYRCIPYDGLIFTLEANSMIELVDLIRNFVEPPVEVFEELIKSQNYIAFANHFEKENF
jgi:hypothetical protein|uniref:Uncharacterized protein n=1 Tax=Bacteriophage sp. TaxID=38018 RepID=A0A8D9PET4_9VIRU|nr:MAG TPA: hypothetical protein [Bacteriophage sp.]